MLEQVTYPIVRHPLHQRRLALELARLVAVREFDRDLAEPRVRAPEHGPVAAVAKLLLVDDPAIWAPSIKHSLKAARSVWSCGRQYSNPPLIPPRAEWGLCLWHC